MTKPITKRWSNVKNKAKGRKKKTFSTNKQSFDSSNRIKKMKKKLTIKKIEHPVETSAEYFKYFGTLYCISRMIYTKKSIEMTLAYLRHHCTNYDNLLMNFSVGSANCGFDKKDFKQYVNEMILKEYNHFKGEINE